MDLMEFISLLWEIVTGGPFVWLLTWVILYMIYAPLRIVWDILRAMGL